MKRKWLVMLLCVALCLAMAFSFAACGDDEDKGKDNGKDNGNTTTEKVTVTFKNGETVVDTIEITKGTAVAATTKTVEAPEGKQFKSWQKDGKDYDFATKVNENITLTATFEDITYTISFKKSATDTDSLKDLKVVRNDYINEKDVPTAPDRSAEHLTFVKWVRADDETADLDFNWEANENVTFIPVYETTQYTVTIKDADADTVLNTQKIPYGGKVTPFEEPVGKEIVSVKLGDADFDFATYTVEGNIEIIVKLAVANRTVKITGEGLDLTFTVPKNGTLSDTDRATLLEKLATAPADGYFWSLDLSKLVNVKEDVTVTATKVAATDYRTAQSWLGLTTKTTDDEKTRYTIVLDKSGTATANPKYRNWGTIFWQEGQYLGLTANVAGTIQFSYNTDKPGQHFTINVYIDGVLFKVETVDSKKQGNITINNVPAGNHVILVEIAAATFDAEGGEPLGEWAGFTISGMRYYEKKPDTCNVTFKNGDEVFKTLTTTRGGTVTAPTDLPTLQYFLFDKWLLNNKEFDFSTPIEDNITLTASFKRDPAYVKVSFVADGKTYADDVYVAVNGTVTAPEGTPTKEGYLFQFWAKKGESTAYDFTAAIAEDLTLEANFKLDANEYTLTFMNGTEKAGEVKVIEGKNGKLPATPDDTVYWTVTAAEYAKLFNVTENRTIAVTTVEKTKYETVQQYINYEGAAADVAKKFTVDFTTGGWKFVKPPFQDKGAYFTMTGDFAQLDLRFWVDKGSVGKYNIYVDDILVKEYTIDATEAAIQNKPFTVLDKTELATGTHTIKIEVVENGAQLLAISVVKAKATT